MSIATPFDVITPATTKRQQLASYIQQQYAQKQGGVAATLSAGTYSSPLGPSAEMTRPFYQNEGLGVTNAAGPNSPMVSAAPGVAATGFNPSGLAGQQGSLQAQQPGIQAGQGLYSDGSGLQAPMLNTTALLQLLGPQSGGPIGLKGF